MRHLIVMRHAKAERGDGKTDYDRELEPRGLADASAIAAAIAEAKLAPDTIICSAARRTRDTLAAMLQHFPGDVEITLRRSLYDAELPDWRDAVRTAQGRCILLIGHNPAIHELALTLGAAEDDRLSQSYPTATASVFGMGFAIDTVRFERVFSP